MLGVEHAPHGGFACGVNFLLRTVQLLAPQPLRQLQIARHPDGRGFSTAAASGISWRCRITRPAPLLFTMAPWPAPGEASGGLASIR